VSTISKRGLGEDLKTHVTYLDCFVPRTRHPDPHVWLVYLSCGSEHAAGGESTRPRATLTTLHLQYEKETEAALGLPPGVHSYALIPIGYPMGRFGPVRRIALADVVYEDRWGEPYRDL
jgi:hypothetical protein